jgi:hypothetical protein
MGVATCSGSWLVLFGVIDLILVAALIVGVVMQSQFLPHGYGPCGDVSNWNNGTDGRNFFLVASTIDWYGENKRASPGDICHSFVLTWILAIVIMCVSIS